MQDKFECCQREKVKRGLVVAGVEAEKHWPANIAAAWRFERRRAFRQAFGGWERGWERGRRGEWTDE